MRNAVIGLGLLAATGFGMEPLGSGTSVSLPVWNAPQNTLFYDHPLILKQYGFGVLGSVVAGALGFYIGNALEGAFYSSSTQHKGYLSFTGIRYQHERGPFWGGGSGVLLGSTITAFFLGDADEEQGSVFWTLIGGGITTAAAFGLADAMGVQESRKWSPFLPLLVVPTTGAILGYHVSRWFNDKERRKATETGSAMLLPPRLAFAPTVAGVAWRLDAINLSF